jgi:single-stranded DNA-binding protein
MPLPLVTVHGSVMSPPRWKPTPAGLPVIHLRLLAVERRQGGDGEYFDGDQYEVAAIAYKDLAENIRDTIKAGDLIIGSGRMRTVRYEAGGKRKVRDELVLSDFAPSLKERRPEDEPRNTQ